jgi:autotransporter adhesin
MSNSEDNSVVANRPTVYKLVKGQENTNCIAFGADSVVIGDHAIAIGIGAQAVGDNAMAIGHGVIALTGERKIEVEDWFTFLHECRESLFGQKGDKS